MTRAATGAGLAQRAAVTFAVAVYAVTTVAVRALISSVDAGLESAAAGDVSTTAPSPIATVDGPLADQLTSAPAGPPAHRGRRGAASRRRRRQRPARRRIAERERRRRAGLGRAAARAALRYGIRVHAAAVRSGAPRSGGAGGFRSRRRSRRRRRSARPPSPSRRSSALRVGDVRARTCRWLSFARVRSLLRWM